MTNSLFNTMNSVGYLWAAIIEYPNGAERVGYFHTRRDAERWGRNNAVWVTETSIEDLPVTVVPKR